MTWATVAATYPCERGEQRSRTGGRGVCVGPTRAPAAHRVAAAFARACAEAANGPNGGRWDRRPCVPRVRAHTLTDREVLMSRILVAYATKTTEGVCCLSGVRPGSYRSCRDACRG